MTVETERAEHFATWRTARRDFDYTLAEDAVRDLLSTLDPGGDLRASLALKYNTGLLEMFTDMGNIIGNYNKDKRLSKGFQALALQQERMRQFWSELYDVFYMEFTHHDLLPGKAQNA
jgi:hypothetical protein